MSDLFGEPPAPLDTSDIDSRWEPDTNPAAEAVAEHDAEVEVDFDEADEVDESASDEVLGDDADDEPAGDEPADDDEPADEPDIPQHLAGKTPAELAKIVQDSQRQIGSQSNEVATLRQISEQQAAQIRELMGYLQEAAQPAPPEVDTSSIAAEALDNPQAAYSKAVRLIDSGQATPDLVDEVIEAVEDMNPKLARQMYGDFQRRMVTAQLRHEFQEQLDKTVKPLAANDYQSQMNLATTSLYNDPVLGDDAKAYEQEVVAMLKGQPLGQSAAEIRAKLESALTVARGQDPTKSSAYKKAVEALKVDAQTELGSGAEPVAKKSEADAYRERVFARATTRDPGASLFG